MNTKSVVKKYALFSFIAGVLLMLGSCATCSSSVFRFLKNEMNTTTLASLPIELGQTVKTAPLRTKPNEKMSLRFDGTLETRSLQESEHMNVKNYTARYAFPYELSILSESGQTLQKTSGRIQWREGGFGDKECTQIDFCSKLEHESISLPASLPSEAFVIQIELQADQTYEATFKNIEMKVTSTKIIDAGFSTTGWLLQLGFALAGLGFLALIFQAIVL